MTSSLPLSSPRRFLMNNSSQTLHTYLLVTSLCAGLISIALTSIAITSTRWINVRVAPLSGQSLDNADATWRVELSRSSDSGNNAPEVRQLDERPDSMPSTISDRSQLHFIIDVCVAEDSKKIDRGSVQLPEINDGSCIDSASIGDVHGGLWKTCAAHNFNIRCDLSRCTDVCDAGIDYENARHYLARHLVTRSPATIASISEQVSTPVAAMVIGGVMASFFAILMGVSILFLHCDVITVAVSLLHAVAGLLQLVGLFVYVATVSEKFGSLNDDGRPYQYGHGLVCLVVGFLSSNIAASSAGYAVSAMHRSHKQVSQLI